MHRQAKVNLKVKKGCVLGGACLMKIGHVLEREGTCEKGRGTCEVGSRRHERADRNEMAISGASASDRGRMRTARAKGART